MWVTLDTSQDPIGPREPLEHSVGDSLRHSLMAAWSSTLDFGAHPGILRCVCVCRVMRMRASANVIVNVSPSLRARVRVSLKVTVWCG